MFSTEFSPTSNFYSSLWIFNAREALFGVDLTDFTEINALQKQWEPFNQMWTITKQWPQPPPRTPLDMIAGRRSRAAEQAVCVIHSTGCRRIIPCKIEN